jgi:hypothetical protein
MYTVAIHNSDGTWEDWKECINLSTAREWFKQALDFTNVLAVEIVKDGFIVARYEYPDVQ